MPYEMRHDGPEDTPYCVYDETGKNRGCSATEEMAEAHRRALFAHETKEALGEAGFALYVKELAEKAREETADINDLPDSDFLYIEPGGKKDETGRTVPRSLRHLPVHDVEHVRNALARLGQKKTGGGEDKWLTDSLRSTLVAKAKKMLANMNKEQATSPLQRAWLAIKELAAPSSQSEEADAFIWKDKSGDYYGLFTYSNNLRDNDTIPEIISKESHLKFEALVEVGAVPLPEARIWHRKEWTIGDAVWVGHDEHDGVIFPMALVKSRPGTEEAWDKLKGLPDLKVSHGMPQWSLKRDKSDPTIIVEHITSEISPLPGWSAANKRTGAIILDKENADMALSKEQKERLLGQYDFSPDILAQLEGLNAANAQEAKENQVESKEKTAADPPPATPAPTPAATPSAAADNSEVVKSLEETMVALIAVADRLATLEKEVKALRQSDTEKVKQTVAQTPLASMTALMQSVVGRKEALVDPTSPLAQDKPKEVDAPALEKDMAGGPTPIAMINRMIAAQQKNGALGGGGGSAGGGVNVR